MERAFTNSSGRRNKHVSHQMNSPLSVRWLPSPHTLQEDINTPGSSLSAQHLDKQSNHGPGDPLGLHRGNLWAHCLSPLQIPPCKPCCPQPSELWGSCWRIHRNPSSRKDPAITSCLIFMSLSRGMCRHCFSVQPYTQAPVPCCGFSCSAERSRRPDLSTPPFIPFLIFF